MKKITKKTIQIICAFIITFLTLFGLTLVGIRVASPGYWITFIGLVLIDLITSLTE